VGVSEDRGQRTEGRRQRAEDRGQKTEGRRQKAEDRRQKTEGRRQRVGFAKLHQPYLTARKIYKKQGGWVAEDRRQKAAT